MQELCERNDRERGEEKGECVTIILSEGKEGSGEEGQIQRSNYQRIGRGGEAKGEGKGEIGKDNNVKEGE